MRKTIFYLCLATGLLSCAKELASPQKETLSGVPMTFDISVAETKAAKTAWANGDVIYVFFKGLEAKYLTLTYNGSSWDNKSCGGILLDTDFRELDVLNLTAVHFPLPVDVLYSNGNYSFTVEDKPFYNYYIFESEKAYEIDGTAVTASLSLGKPEKMVLFHVAGIQDSVADYSFGCPLIQPVACKSVGVDGTITEDVLQAGVRLKGFADSDGGIFAGRLTYPSKTAYTFTLADNDKIYTLTRGSALTAGKMYNIPALSDVRWTSQKSSDLYVDLGLSVKWAKCNLGASAPEEFGDYFAWGEVQPKNEYNWETYRYCNGSNKSITKYIMPNVSSSDDSIDNKPVLEMQDDAAYVRLGGKWRMPEKDEWKELIEQCSWAWVSNYNETGVKGCLVTNNETGQSIFLPAGGYMDISGSHYVSKNGRYWSSTVYTGKAYGPDVAYIKDFSATALTNLPSLIGRYCGLLIRPVFAE